MTNLHPANLLRRVRAFVLLASLPCASLLAPQLHAQASVPEATAMRTISGTVTDASGEPLKGAVVELENQDSHLVITYLTDAEGHFAFHRVNSSIDFVVAVKYRGHHARPKSVSKFNSHLQTVLNFKVDLY